MRHGLAAALWATVRESWSVGPLHVSGHCPQRSRASGRAIGTRRAVASPPPGSPGFRAALTCAHLQTARCLARPWTVVGLGELRRQRAFWTSNRPFRRWDAPPCFRATATHRYRFRGCPKWASNENEMDINGCRDGHTARSGVTRDDPSKGGFTPMAIYVSHQGLKQGQKLVWT